MPPKAHRMSVLPVPQSRNGQQMVLPAEWEEDFEEGLVKINMSNLEVKLI